MIAANDALLFLHGGWLAGWKELLWSSWSSSGWRSVGLVVVLPGREAVAVGTSDQGKLSGL